MDKRLVRIGEALLGVDVTTLRRWQATGELLPARKSKAGTRYYSAGDLMGLGDADAPTVCYARVSSHDQKEDLDEIVIIHKGEQPSFEEELAKDVLEMITVFSARLYGSRSIKNRELIDSLKAVAEKA